MVKELIPGAPPPQALSEQPPLPGAPATYTDPATLPADVRQKLLKIRDALMVADLVEAYHQLHQIADTERRMKDSWSSLERG